MVMVPPLTAHPEGASPLSRRGFVAATNAAMGASVVGKLAWDDREGMRTSEVFIAKVAGYETDFTRVVGTALRAVGVSASRLRGKRVLLKPNLVDAAAPSRSATTHPNVVHAVAECFRRWGVRDVAIADGSGLVRDPGLVLEATGIRPVLRDLGIRFIDLNTDRVRAVRNAGGCSGLDRLFLPESVLEADLVVSLAKMKTHHWAGVSLAMKNLFGVLPGICYGWPKNLLHVRGIDRTVLDVNATLRAGLAIVDGIVGMEGDGPLSGTPRRAGVLVFGRNPTAVDATSIRLMGGAPDQIGHLAAASGWLGPIRQPHIPQRGETLAHAVTPFRFPEQYSAMSSASESPY